MKILKIEVKISGVKIICENNFPGGGCLLCVLKQSVGYVYNHTTYFRVLATRRVIEANVTNRVC